MTNTQGKLFYVIGPSGAGKDSVLKTARMQSPAHVWFAHRYITRPADDPSENHISLTETEFQNRVQLNAFSLHWNSNGLKYGIGIEIDHWLKNGSHVVVNGSREALPRAIDRYPNLLPIIITAEETILRQRLTKRGRESQEAIEQRVKRNAELTIDHPALHTIYNHGTLDTAAKALLLILTH